MGKIFRLHKGAAENVNHWKEVAGHLGENYITSIDDPAGNTSKTQITSIPTPFARMDLVRTAFKNLASGELDGNSIHHKIASECLDIAEIFFNIDALSDKVEIIEWNSGIIQNGGELDIDRESDLGRLVYSANPKHKLLGETLRMYLFQDRAAFNFSNMRHCYLLNYIQGPGVLNIIGGTSPASLYFSSANNLDFVQIGFGNHLLFGDAFCPLYSRNKEFIRFMYSMREAFPEFSTLFPDIDRYMERCFGFLDDRLKSEIRNQEGSYTSLYHPINVGSTSNHAEILGFTLRGKGNAIKEDDNEFLIRNTRSTAGLRPCVLPNEPFSHPLRYAGGVWEKKFHENVPYFDGLRLEERRLPNQPHIRYPYLTVSDLLEPYLIKFPFPIDTNKFFSGNLDNRTGSLDYGFALPLKRVFFEYFSVNDLQGFMDDGKSMFEFITLPGGVKVILRIPIQPKGLYIQFSRVYTYNQFQDRVQQPDEKLNLGIVVECQLNVAVYPFMRMPGDINPNYRILLADTMVDPLNRQAEASLQFINDSTLSVIKPTAVKVRSSKQQVQGVTSKYYVLEESFDVIEVRHPLYGAGLIIPLFPQPASSKKTFRFAVDFGTTNTHIEYQVKGDNQSEAFNIGERDMQLATLNLEGVQSETALSAARLGLNAINLLDIIRVEFVPYLIGKGQQHRFPQRSVINDNDAFNPTDANYALADFNIPFWYLKENMSLNAHITPNLKWADMLNVKLERRVLAFIKQIMLMLRNKVLLNGGDLELTEIVWSYPSSMSEYRKAMLHHTWSKYYHRYFNGNAGNVFRMSESLAPFHYFSNQEGVKALDKPVASIDIGGGTSDAVIYVRNMPAVLTSFRFASNTLFGDGYGNSHPTNGFVYKYEKIIRESLLAGPAKRLVSIYDQLKASNSKSLELIEFYFSVEDNKLVRDHRISLSFSALLSSDQELKIVLLFYYSAIIYHIARLMKAKGLDAPRSVTFSGNGSKVVTTISGGGKNFSSLELLTKAIFEDVYGAEQQSIALKLYDHPKEITAKGGLECKDYSRYQSLEQNIKEVFVGTTDGRLNSQQPVTYNDLDNGPVIDSACTETEHFIDAFFSWNRKVSYAQHFGVKSGNLEKLRALMKEDIRAFLLAGIEAKLQERQDHSEEKIDETLFFYPIAGIINKIAYQIQIQSENK